MYTLLPKIENYFKLNLRKFGLFYYIVILYSSLQYSTLIQIKLTLRGKVLPLRLDFLRLRKTPLCTVCIS